MVQSDNVGVGVSLVAPPYAHLLLAIQPNVNKVLGMALYYFQCSSFAGLPSPGLDDLYVTPATRGWGV